ncbi:hypothetical protein M422DRAFT_253753 [Sphaerobolus stellatus SS14]|uniref:Uncharacterized protein n=1 Tax=Sphaerobolus stellatus (strain SS14) TaxID=990650 RepID=A0A0C9V7I5_SPHS4|nr:hypothetical protein M422DRAFT_253753 [Sphaerobolus stellatus SS14]
MYIVHGFRNIPGRYPIAVTVLHVLNEFEILVLRIPQHVCAHPFPNSRILPTSIPITITDIAGSLHHHRSGPVTHYVFRPWLPKYTWMISNFCHNPTGPQRLRLPRPSYPTTRLCTPFPKFPHPSYVHAMTDHHNSMITRFHPADATSCDLSLHLRHPILHTMHL